MAIADTTNRSLSITSHGRGTRDERGISCDKDCEGDSEDDATQGTSRKVLRPIRIDPQRRGRCTLEKRSEGIGTHREKGRPDDAADAYPDRSQRGSARAADARLAQEPSAAQRCESSYRSEQNQREGIGEQPA